MRIPMNAIQWYIGWPFLFALVVRGFMVRKKSQNSLNHYFLIAASVFLMSQTVSGLAPLLTTDPAILSIAIMLGSMLEFIATFVGWLLVARMYAPQNPIVRGFITGVSFIVLCIGLAIAGYENLTQPTTLSIVNGSWYIDYPFSLPYQIVTALQYSSLIFIAIKFWMLSGAEVSPVQRWRLRGFAIGLSLIGGVFIALPFLDTTGSINESQAIIILVGVALMSIFTLATILYARTQRGSSR